MNQRIDLNLLTVFEAIWRERSVAQAADRLSLSQPAVSHALARLRDLTNDPLFERSKTGMRPTPRATAMWPSVSEGLNASRRALGAQAEPYQIGRRIWLGMTNNVALTVTAQLTAHMAKVAPDLDLGMRTIDRITGRDFLDRGVVDGLVGFWPELTGQNLQRYRIYTDKLVLVAAKEHPVLRAHASTEEFVKYPHVLVSPAGDELGPVDQALADLGCSRRISLVVPDYALAAEAIAEGSVIGALARGPAMRLSRRLPLAWAPLPVGVAPISIDLIASKSASDLSTWFSVQLRTALGNDQPDI